MRSWPGNWLSSVKICGNGEWLLAGGTDGRAWVRGRTTVPVRHESVAGADDALVALTSMFRVLVVVY
jgi:hypothetical protein